MTMYRRKAPWEVEGAIMPSESPIYEPSSNSVSIARLAIVGQTQ
jgi:hypothetical protein